MAVTPKFKDYANKYDHVAMTRGDGILELTFHTDSESLIWTLQIHDELAYLFDEIAGDRDNKVVILTGAGDAFCDRLDHSTFSSSTPGEWDRILYDGRRLLNNLLAINVPVISAVNGPARFHAEIPAMSDIVIASETTLFQDLHYTSGVVPGDGAHIVWTHLLGPNRGRYFLMMGQELDAQTAFSYGVVSEVLSSAQVLPRAREIASTLAAKPFLMRRYAREVLTLEYKRLMQAGISVGLGFQGLAKTDSNPYS